MFRRKKKCEHDSTKQVEPEAPKHNKRAEITHELLAAILDNAPNPYVVVTALRILLSPQKVREEWYQAGYRFPIEPHVHEFLPTEPRTRWLLCECGETRA